MKTLLILTAFLEIAAGLGLAGVPSFAIRLLFYNISVASVLLFAGLALSLSGVLLWPAILLHVSLAMGCGACLSIQSKSSGHKRPAVPEDSI